MKILNILQGIVSIVTFIIIIFVIITISNRRGHMLSKLGTTYVIGKDTLTITDYSILFQNYTLSNGTTVYRELVK